MVGVAMYHKVSAVSVYHLSQSRAAEEGEDFPGFTVHRFGGDKARQLLAHAAGRMADRVSRLSERTGSTYRPSPPSAERAAEA